MCIIPSAWLAIALALPAAPAFIANVPHVEQLPDFCGEACAEMFLRKLGHTLSQNDVFDRSGLDPAEGRGCHTQELATALGRIGFNVGEVWHPIRAATAGAELAGQWEALVADLGKEVPSIVCMRTSSGPDATEHFRLVLGFDSSTDELIYHEPAQPGGAYQRMARAKFLDLWPLKYERDKWLAIRLRLEPGSIRATPSPAGRTNADYAQHVLALKQKLPSKSFSIVLARPFVVVGDEAAEVVRSRANSTVEWAVRKLKRQYFTKDPEEIIDIWLFKDKASYETHARQLFGSPPTTPFGYYSAEHRALVMNISTGGGTLVHEIVHPYMRVNFPGCPTWFNEGLASLYEQSIDRNGSIAGATNWRLEGLQKALRAGRVPSFPALLSTTEGEFYNGDRGTNYAQARYLCYYLQEKGLLESFYRELVRTRGVDRTGLQALAKTLGRDDKGMADFEKEWGSFVLGLKFP